MTFIFSTTGFCLFSLTPVEALRDLPSLGKNRNGSCLWAAASCRTMPCTLPPQPPLKVLLLASFSLTFWDCQYSIKHFLCFTLEVAVHSGAGYFQA